MQLYNGKVTTIGNNFDNKKFPRRFSNEIYLSNIDTDFYYKYVSPFSIKYALKGQESYRLGNKLNQVAVGQALIINEGTEVVCEKIAAKSPSSAGMSIFLDKDVINDTISVITKRGDIPEGNYDRNQLFNFYDDIIRSDDSFQHFLHMLFSKYYQTNKDVLIEEYYDIAAHLLNFQFRFFSKVQDLDKVKFATRKEIYSRVEKARDYLENSYMKNFDLEILARESAMSKYFLIRSFKSIYRKTPQQYHIELRIEKAKRLLQEDCSISEVAALLGYANISCFSKQFKKLTNLPPSGFRQRIV